MKKIIIAAIAALLMLNSQAQLKIPPTDPRITKAAEEKKKIDKILNATLLQVRFTISNDKFSYTWFRNRTLAIASYKAVNNFSLYLPFNESATDNTQNAHSWIFKNNDQKITYKILLNGGFGVFIKLSDPGPRVIGKPFEANFFVELIFSDGNRVKIRMQDLITGNSALNKFETQPINFSKVFRGNDVMPDPENPLKVPEIK